MILVGAILLTLTACNRGDCEHSDDNSDGVCDKCSESMENGDQGGDCSHRDSDDDGVCDKCSKAFSDGIEDGTPVNITQKYGSDIVVVYGKNVSGSAGNAYTIAEILFIFDCDCSQVDDTSAESECEIIVGRTDRELSKRLEAEAAKLTDAVYVWGYAYENGKLAYYFNSKSAFNYSLEDFKTRFVKSDGLIANEGTFEIYYRTQKQLDDEESTIIEQNRAQKLQEVKEANNAFTNDVFGKAELMPTSAFPAPSFDVTTVSHPRLLVNKDMLPAIRELLAKDSTDKEFADMRRQFWKYADTEGVTGIFVETGADILYKNGTPNDPSDDYYLKNKFDREILSQVEAKALAYLITGDELYGYEAIRACKNMMLTLRYWDNKQQDTYWGASMTAYVISHVYDWCYDLLSENDKNQIIGGVRTLLLPQLEFKYPPSNMSGVSGHGTGRQMFVDYLSLAIAFADERPDWWAFVGGRFYAEYIPVLNEMYSSGFVSQGTYYGTRKWGWHLMSIYMLAAYGDTESIDKGVANTAYSTAALILPNGNFLQNGDNRGWRNHYPEGDSEVGAYWMLLGAGLTKDPAFLELAKEYSNNYTKLDLNEMRLTPAIYPILIACCSDVNTDESSELPTIVYNGHPGGQTVIKSSLEEDAAFAYMRILDKTMANHEHSDSGTFQIYYKGLLACESGYYEGVLYGKEHWKHYLTATVAHNGMLVYDAAYRDTLPEAERKYYSGSQKRLNEAGTIEKWNNGTYDLAQILGHAEGYRHDGTSKYAYISGNTTNAYIESTVDYVKRSMLTVMTDNAEIPMLFFVYDDVTSKNEEAIKKFLLHTINEPTIEGNTVTVTEGEGKLVLTALIGADKIEGIGGQGKGFWVCEDGENGYNVKDGVQNGWEDSLWGRVEISATGEKTDKMLNVMYVTDKNSSASLTPLAIENDVYAGAVAGNTVALFMKSRKLYTDAFSFTVEGSADMEYYIAGLENGTWTVSVNGQSIGDINVTDDSGMLSFKASAGEITVTPTALDIRYPITYELAGGTNEGGAPTYYKLGVGVSMLPTPTHPSAEFLGWYTDENYQNPIEEITAEQTGELKLYAKWRKYPSTYVDTDCSNINGVDGWSGSTAAVTLGGDTVIKWTPALGNTIKTDNATEGYGVMYGDKIAVSYFVTVAKVKGEELVKNRFRIFDPNGKELNIFTIDENGVVRLGYYTSDSVVCTLTEELTAIRIVLDFEASALIAYDADGNVIANASVKSPDTNYATLEEWRQSFGADFKKIFNWRAESAGAMYVGDIKILEGNIFDTNTDIKYPITYELFGGSFGGSYPMHYVVGAGVSTLPTPTLDGATFGGWYKDAALTVKVESIHADSIGAITLYAKWQKPPAVYVDYDCSYVNGIVQWSGTATATNLGDATVVKWTPASQNKLHAPNAEDGYGILYSDEKTVSYEITLSRDESAVVKSVFRLVNSNDDSGSTLNIFTIDENGVVRLGSYTSDAVVCTLTEELTTLKIVLDFKNESITAYLEGGTTVSTVAKSSSKNFTTIDEWRAAIGDSKNVFNWRAESAGTLYVDNIKIAEGNLFD